MTRRNKHEGGPLEDFLREEGIYAEVTARAIKEVIAEQLADVIEREGVTKTEMARRLGTSRSALDRLLDPDDPNLNLKVFTLAKVAEALGKRMEFRFKDA